MTEHEKKRFDARTLAIRDLDISFRGRLLYVYIDDLAGFRGAAYPRQITVAETLGMSIRQVKRCYAELEGRYITSKRVMGGSSSRVLVWTKDCVGATGGPTWGQKKPIEGPRVARVFLEPRLEPVRVPDQSNESQSQPPCWCTGTGYYPVGSGQPCRECETGWANAKLGRRA